MKRTLSILISCILLVGLAGYCVYLWTQGSLMTTTSMVGQERVAAIILIAVCVVLGLYATIATHTLNKPKLILSLLSVFLMMCGAYLFVDTVESMTYLSDATRVVGVYFLIATLAGFVGIVDGTQNTSTGSAHRVKGAEVIEI